jgi:hypothetical protein
MALDGQRDSMKVESYQGKENEEDDDESLFHDQHGQGQGW